MRKPLDTAALLAAGVISKSRDGVRILAKGELISEKVEIHAAGASKAAIAAVEKAGGKIEEIEPKDRVEKKELKNEDTDK